ncbi:MAG: N-glycosylase [Candidatus Aenigmarchaeota archaeon]|nr:N-glycosylase [Candidatus Aenigmarchaeota archaeon]
MKIEVNKLLEFYENKKVGIRKFIRTCDMKDDECLFGELCFCILTPQSRARNCREVVDKLKADKKLFTADLEEIRNYLKRVRFPERKAVYIIEARKKLPEIKRRINGDPKEFREWLIENIRGIGLKESSHFMRNVGFKGLTIIDVHIQNFLRRIGYNEKGSGSLTKKQYIELENKFLRLSKELKIPPEELDIAIWLYQSGEKEFYG